MPTVNFGGSDIAHCIFIFIFIARIRFSIMPGAPGNVGNKTKRGWRGSTTLVPDAFCLHNTQFKRMEMSDIFKFSSDSITRIGMYMHTIESDGAFARTPSELSFSNASSTDPLSLYVFASFAHFHTRAQTKRLISCCRDCHAATCYDCDTP